MSFRFTTTRSPTPNEPPASSTSGPLTVSTARSSARRTVIQIGDIGPQAERSSRSGRASPRASQSATSRSRTSSPVGSTTSALVVGVQLQRFVGPALPKVIERHSLPAVDLPNVLGQLDREPSLDEPTERATGADLRQLPMVTDQHDLALDALDLADELRELPSRNHPSLIDHEYASTRQTRPSTASEITEQSGDARALDAGAGLQLVRRTPSCRNAENRIAGGLPRLASRTERERLARSGLPGDDRDTVAARDTTPRPSAAARRTTSACDAIARSTS